MAQPEAQLTDPSIGRGPIDRWFHDRFGGKRGFLTAIRCGIRRILGGYRDNAEVDFGVVRRLVFVCVGNICRSPYAEVRAREAGLVAASFGLAARTGDPANPNAVAVGGQRGIDLRAHHATALEDFSLQTGDLLLGCEPGHVDRLREWIGARDDVQVALLGLFAASPTAYLHDPYGLGPAFFRTSYQQIDAAVDGLAGRATRARVAGTGTVAGS